MAHSRRSLLVLPLLLSGAVATALALPPQTAGGGQSGRPHPVGEHPAWLGCWRTEDGAQTLWLEPDRCGWLRDGTPTFYRVEYGEGSARLESWARFTDLTVHLEEGTLVVGTPGGELRMAATDRVPRGLLVEPYPLPEVELDPDTVTTVAEDLALRRDEDQRVRRAAQSGGGGGEMMRVDEDNTEFLVGLIQELGWIDAERFGAEAADNAFLLVQHSADMRLMRTALPRIQADVEAGRLGGQAFALLYDRFQLRLGYRQLYGSQLGSTADGVSVLMPCQEPDAVDEHRAKMGMGPLADYIALFEADGDEVVRLDELPSGR